MKALLCLLGWVLPWSLRRIWLQSLFGYSIDPTAKVGFSIVLPGQLRLGPGARIGHLNVIKGLSRVELGEDSSIGNLNWITGFPEGHPVHFAHEKERKPELIIGDQSAVTHRHYLDCTASIRIGRFTTVAGVGSQLMTHSIDLEISRQGSAPILIGDYCFVGTNCVLLGGAVLPDYCVLGAKSLLNKKQMEKYRLYGGLPARELKQLSGDMAYFKRSRGYVN